MLDVEVEVELLVLVLVDVDDVTFDDEEVELEVEEVVVLLPVTLDMVLDDSVVLSVVEVVVLEPPGKVEIVLLASSSASFASFLAVTISLVIFVIRVVCFLIITKSSESSPSHSLVYSSSLLVCSVIEVVRAVISATSLFDSFLSLVSLIAFSSDLLWLYNFSSSYLSSSNTL